MCNNVFTKLNESKTLAFHKSVKYKFYIIIFGGKINGGYTYNEDLIIYNIKKNKWNILNKQIYNKPKKRIGHAMIITAL